MPKQLTGRTTLIVLVLLSCLYILFPNFWRGDLSPNIRPGIDMVGGSSLLYQIKGAEDGSAPAADLAERTISALRERVDPEGVKNLVWRAQGADKIEIQLPATKETEAAAPIRKAYADAQAAIDALNVRPAQVEAALRRPADQRDVAMAELAKGSPARAGLLAEIAAARGRLDDARSRQDAAAQAEAQIAYDGALAKLPRTNVEVSELDSALSTKKEDREQRLNALRAEDPNNAPLQAAIDQYVAAYDQFQTVKNAVGDVGELKSLLRGSGVLTWHIAVKPLDAGAEVVQQMIERLDRDGPRARPGDEMAWFPLDRDDGNVGLNSVAHVHDGTRYLLVWTRPDKSMRNRPDAPKWTLQQAYTTYDERNSQVVGFAFDAVGANLFGDMTGRHAPQSPNGPFDLAAVLDGKVISNASINSRIGAQGTISGGGSGFGRAELDYLVRTLNAGALPAQLDEEPLVERTVGPQLGADNLRAGFVACIFGIVIVAIFLIGYYFLSGVVATLAVLLNIILILAGMSALGATFTLAGVAGIILTIGMAVDSNVLIFERLREEQQRGLSLRLAMRNAYDRAFSAILDSNVTAAITGVILYVIGTEDVKGFGLTLLLGIIASLFTALFVTKTIFAFLINHFGVESLSSVPLRFPAWDRLTKPKIDWMAKRYVFFAGSLAFIVAGLALFVVNFAKGRVLDIEFAGGTVVQFNLNEPMTQEAVRDLIEREAEEAPGRLDAPNVQAVGDSVATASGAPGYTTYEVVTVTADATAVRGALGEALAGKLDVAQAAMFEAFGEPVARAIDADIVEPITAETRELAGFTPRGLADHVGGVAVILKNLTPMLTEADVRARLDQARLAAAGSFRAYAVEATPDGTGMVILASDPNFPYDANNASDWQVHVAGPTWDRVNDAVGKPAAFSRVSSINQTVAGETSTKAVIALITSVLLIVIYVWMRFGDLKFGSATVVALLHDVFVVLAAIGFAHLLAGSFIGEALLLEPFRMNLTMVSAILTIIGFSMSDTVVIFDRVRENRAMVGHLDRKVVNDSINQTISRTLLTGGTTIVTLTVMYIIGGPAIHGFTFAMVVGLLTGTYSSIAIASPLILLGTGKLNEPTPAADRPALT